MLIKEIWTMIVMNDFPKTKAEKTFTLCLDKGNKLAILTKFRIYKLT